MIAAILSHALRAYPSLFAYGPEVEGPPCAEKLLFRVAASAMLGSATESLRGRGLGEKAALARAGFQVS